MFGRWIVPGSLALGLVACAQRDTALPPLDPPPPGASTGTGATGGAGGGASTGGAGQGAGAAGTGGTGAAGSSGARVDAGLDGGASDSGPDTPLVIIHQDGSTGGATCANDFTAHGSNRLVAGGATPTDFANAYNAEVAASSTPGPLLFAFYGVNETNLLGWVAAVGAPIVLEAGGGVGFADAHAEVPFALGFDRSLHIATVAADFPARLPTPNGSAVLPIGSIALDGALSVGCGSLTVDNARLLVPMRAGALAFHGSTVATLMGPPTETLGGVARSAWPLELSGKAAQVYAPGLLADGGIEP